LESSSDGVVRVPFSMRGLREARGLVGEYATSAGGAANLPAAHIRPTQRGQVAQ